MHEPAPKTKPETTIPLSYSEPALRSMIRQEVEAALNDRFSPTYRIIPDDRAREEIISFIRGWKTSGKDGFSVSDVVSALRLPAEQVEEILEAFERQGKLKGNL